MKRRGMALLALTAGLCFWGLFLSGNAEAASKVKIDRKHFPGKIFREYVRGFDTNKDGYLSKKERDAVKRIEVDNGKLPSDERIGVAPVADMKGLKHFTQTKELILVCYRMKNLKFDGLKKLERVEIYRCIKVDRKPSDKEYDFSKNKKLKEVTLTEIGSTVDKFLFAKDNKIRKFIMEVPDKLKKLDLGGLSQVSEVRITGGAALESIDFGKCAMLKKAEIMYNKKLTSLDFSGNPNLEEFSAFKNNLAAMDISKSRKLKRLEISYNGFTELDMSQNAELREIDCSHNLLETLDVSALKKLRTLRCYGLKLKELNLTENLELKLLGCDGNQLETLDLSSNTKLLELYCGSNQLETLDLSSNTELLSVACGANPLEELDVSMHPKLTYLSCVYARLSALDVANNRKLTSLYYAGNRIPSIDLTGHSVLISGPEKVAEMLKSQLLPSADSLPEEGILIDKGHFPDYALRYEVLADFDVNHDGILSEKESLAKRPLNLAGHGSAIRREIDCTGMEYLKGITEVKAGSRTTLLNNTFQK